MTYQPVFSPSTFYSTYCHWMFLPKIHKIHFKILFYYLKYTHVNWAKYLLPILYPQSIFPASSSVACQLQNPKIYPTAIPNYSLIPDHKWFMTSHYPAFALSANRLKSPTRQIHEFFSLAFLTSNRLLSKGGQAKKVSSSFWPHSTLCTPLQWYLLHSVAIVFYTYIFFLSNCYLLTQEC